MKNSLTIVIISLFSLGAVAQTAGDHALSLNWNLGGLVNNPFVKNFSARGGSIGYTQYLSSNLAVGGEIGWNNYFQYAPMKTYYLKSGAVTTDMYKYVFAVPVTVSATRFTKIGSHIFPYGKLALGTMYSEQNLYYNIYESTSHNWGFTVIPEIGAQVKLDALNRWSFKLGVQYQYATNRAADYNIKNLQAIQISTGINWQIF